jgi:hypothetical protein
MGTQRVQMKEDLPCLIRWACRASTRYFLFCLGCSSRLIGQYEILFFPHHTLQYFNPFFPIAQQAGYAVVLGCHSLSMCLWSYPPCPTPSSPNQPVLFHLVQKNPESYSPLSYAIPPPHHTPLTPPPPPPPHPGRSAYHC